MGLVPGAVGLVPIENRYQQRHFQVLMACVGSIFTGVYYQYFVQSLKYPDGEDWAGLDIPI